MGYQKYHWRIYNVHRRLFALLACAVGTAFILQAPFQRLGWMDGPPLKRSEILVGCVVGAVAIAVGVYLCRRPAYRPDLGDVHYFSHSTGGPMPTQPVRGNRSWWTGDPKGLSSDRDHVA